MRLQVRVVMDLPPVGTDRRVRVVKDRSFEPTNRAIHVDHLVHEPAVEAGEILVKESDMPRISRRSSVVLERPSHEIRGYENAVRLVIWACDDATNLGCHFRRDLLVCVDVQDPHIARKTHPEILLRPIAGPIPLHYASS